MAADNQPYFTIKWFKMGFHLIDVIIICDKKILTAKANGQFYLHSCIFGALCYIFTNISDSLLPGHQ